DDASPRAANWLHTAVDAIAENALASGRPLPADKLEAFVKDTRHAGAARRVAYEWLVRADAKAPDRLLPALLDEPGSELRRDAVNLKQAQDLLDTQDKPGATAAFKKALAHARERDQVNDIAKQLKELGVEVDVTAHFGFVTRWMLLGPFDSTGGIGFKTVYPP